MAQVTVTVNGRKFRMSCSDGAEQRVKELAAQVDTYVQDIKGGYRHVQDDWLFLMAALMLADQLAEARTELHHTLTQICNLHSPQTADKNISYIPSGDVSRIVDASSKRLEALATRLKAAG
ncbi:MAG: cell division protein ZapA [Alphaproteobacteria bacterium]|jgi:cell division protein ZapA